MIKKTSLAILILIPMLIAAIAAGCQNPATGVTLPTRTSTAVVNSATITRTSTIMVANTATVTRTITQAADTSTITATVTETASAMATATTTSTAGSYPLVVLGSAASFGAFGSAGVTNSDDGTTLTLIRGDIGSAGALSTITGFGPSNFIGTMWGLDSVSTIVTTVFNDATTAYNYLAGLPVTATDPGAELGTLTLPPGTYANAGGTFTITAGNLTLDSTDPNAVWVFKMATTLQVGDGTGPKSVILLHQAQAKNVYWQVGSAAYINAAGGGDMEGTIIANAAISFSTAGYTTPTILNGRAISLGASVTMVTTDITVPQ